MSPASALVRSVHVCGGLTELGGRQAAQSQLREARDEAAARQEQFEKELATARSLADMNRELASDRAARCTELEGIIRELQRNMEARAGMTRGDAALLLFVSGPGRALNVGMQCNRRDGR